jgi:hypothetical protein
MAPEIYALVVGVRKWCEENRTTITTKPFDKTLSGMCAIASSRLYEVLKQHGYTSVIAMAEHRNGVETHCFVVYEDFILDVTSSQFCKDKITVRHTKEVLEWYWQVDLEFMSVEALRRYQKKTWCMTHQVVDIDAIKIKYKH